jgi:hypothetical protein
LDFVAVGLVFVAIDLVFVAPNFDFVARALLALAPERDPPSGRVG